MMDIKAELAKPGRDPRKQFELFSFAEGINKIGDLEVGMELPGIVTNMCVMKTREVFNVETEQD